MKLESSVQGYGVGKLQENLQLSYNFWSHTKCPVVTEGGNVSANCAVNP